MVGSSDGITVKRLAARILLCAAVTVTILFACTLVGPTDLPVGRALRSFLDGQGGRDLEIYRTLRVERVLVAALVGASLALSGGTLQGILRNPLAEPYILGISGGAAMGVILGEELVSSEGWVTAAFAFTGGTLTVFGLLMLTRRFGLTDPSSLILTGVILNAIFGAALLLYFSVVETHRQQRLFVWLMGNLNEVDFARDPVWWALSASLLVCGLYLVASGYRMNILSMGKETAMDLGLDAPRIEVKCLAAAAVVTGGAVAVAGPVGFVGLIVPHLVRNLLGPDHRVLLPVALCGGAAFLAVADTAARSAVPGNPIPVGAVTAMAGGPFFIYLMARTRRTGWAV